MSEPPLVIVAVCPFCGGILDRIPVEEGETWGPATRWGIVAQASHLPRCPVYWRPPIPGLA